MKNITYTIQITLPKIGAKLMQISIRTEVIMSGWVKVYIIHIVNSP